MTQLSELTGGMLDVTVNGASHALPAPTLDAALATIGVPRDTRHIAIAVNDSLVPRARWPEITLHRHDRVEIITAVAGG